MQNDQECWLCRTSHTKETKKFHQFIIENAHQVSIDDMAAQFYQMYPQHITQEKVKEHIDNHCLHPEIQVSKILRQLLTLSQNLNKISTNYEGEDGSPMIDIRAVQTYVKVVGEIMQIYRTTDIKQLLYSTT